MSRIPLPHAISRLLITTASLLACNPVFAQTEEQPGDSAAPLDENWYKVEMIVFSQNGNTSENGEIWRTDVELDYPLDWIELLKPAELMTRIAKREEAAAAQQDSAQGLIADGQATSSDRLPTSEAASPQSDAITTEPSVADGADNAGNPGTRLAPEDSEAVKVPGPVEALAEKALLLLPSEELTLSSEARRLSRSERHRILFHGAWLQPLAEDRKQPSVLISGGERFDEHQELEGSVNIYRRTYLHIETDLWLSQFVTNFGQERRPWPPLPWPPNRTPEPSFLFRINDGGTGLWHQFNQGQDDDVSAILAQPYVVENVVLMQQGRRMRSEELHYIDHPKMGLLIKITPYQPPETDGESSRRS